MATVTLLALAVAAPEISLCFWSTFIEVKGVPNDLGPMVVMGTTSFNLLLITGISILMAVEVKKLYNIVAFLISGFFATFALVWIYLILQVISPGFIELWEAVFLLVCYPVMIVVIYLNENCNESRRQDHERLDENRRAVARHSLISRANEPDGKLKLIDMVTGR